MAIRALLLRIEPSRRAGRNQRGTVLARAILVAALLSCGALVTPRPAVSATVHDSDQDSLPDDLERRTGTNPFDADTDGDGVMDGDEDSNRDGKVDEGESDPRVPGLFPGSIPHIPEPLVFDLVRGLGARAGELEANVLALFRPDRPNVLWAPEIEWAFADGYAAEIEFPMVEDELDALKVAVQGTLPSRRTSFAHGWQVFGESSTDWKHGAVVGTYILGHRFHRQVSALGMLGGKVEVDGPEYDRSAGVFNTSLFYEPREWQTWGVESNLEAGTGGRWSLRVTPQVHLQLSHNIRAQLGVGFERTGDGIEPIGALRLIVEAGTGAVSPRPPLVRSGRTSPAFDRSRADTSG